MKKTVWIINQYASTLDYGIGGRHYYFAKELAKKGYKVFLFSATNHHLLRRKKLIEDAFLLEKIDGFNYVWIKMPDYEHAHSKRRIFNEFLFSWKIRRLNKIFSQDLPDVILYSTPALIPYIGAYSLSKKLNARLVLDVRDLWPLTLIEMGGYSKRHPFIQYLQYVENKAYKTADLLISNWPYAINYMKEHNANPDHFTWIPNGFSLDEFNDSLPLTSDFLDTVPKNKFIVGYTGTLGTANALNSLLNAAQLLQTYEDIAIVVVGGGKDQNIFENELKKRGLHNVFYLGNVEKRKIPSVLALFDACYVGFLDIPLYRFGSSLTKLPEYFASAKPIVYASNSPFQPVEKANAGITVEAENAHQIAQAILELYQMPKDKRHRLGENGRQVALEQYEYGMLAEKLADVLFDRAREKV